MSGRAVWDAGSLWDKVVAGLAVLFIGAGVIGLFTMNSSVVRLEERVSNWTLIYEKRFADIAADRNRRFEILEKKIDDFQRELRRP